MRSLPTWAGRSQFEYSGSVHEGVSLRFAALILSYLETAIEWLTAGILPS